MHTSYSLILILLCYCTITITSFNQLTIRRKIIISTAKTMSKDNNNNNMDYKYISQRMKSILLQSGDVGQIQGNRLHFHKINAKRTFSDHFIWSHVFLIIGSITAFINKIYELSVLIAFTTILSTLYHYEYEKPSYLAKLEGLSAKILFIYGACQTIFKAPFIYIKIIELFLLITTLSFFLITNIFPESYDKYHCFGLHIIPALWAIVVATYHTPFII